MSTRSAPSPERDKLEQKLVRATGKAIADYDMIQDGDRIMVAVSGGKDSYTMLHVLRLMQKRAPVNFELKVINIDQGHPGYPAHLLTEYMAQEGHDFQMIKEDTYSIVVDKIPAGKTMCSLCSRLRRGILYRVATDLGCTKIALGHHREDVLQTLMLNLFFAGQIGAMPPRLVADEGRHTVIRPLVYCAETDIQAFSNEMQFPILPCDLCGSQENLQRKQVGKILNDMEEKHPGMKQVMLHATQNIHASHMLDRDLWKRLGIGTPNEQETKLVAATKLTRLREAEP